MLMHPMPNSVCKYIILKKNHGIEVKIKKAQSFETHPVSWYILEHRGFNYTSLNIKLYTYKEIMFK